MDYGKGIGVFIDFIEILTSLDSHSPIMFNLNKF